MNIGLVGLGAMGKNHLRVLSELNVLKVVCDTDLKQLETIVKEHPNLLCTSSLEILLAQDLDAIVIAVPTQHHLPVAEQCLAAGKHVLVEKPIAESLCEARALQEAGEKHDRFIGVGYIERFNLAFQDLLSDIGHFGEITSVNIKRVGGSPRSATNVVLDLMTHDIDLIMQIFNGNKPDAINSHFRKNDDGVVDSAQVLMSFGTASATCEANWVSPVKVREVHVTGTKGYAKIDMIRREITRISGHTVDTGKTVLQLHDSRIFMQEPLREELKAFINEVENYKTFGRVRSRKIMNAAEALNVLEVTLDIAKSEGA